MPSLFIISDIHIQGDQDPLYRALLHSMEVRPKSGDIFVFAGDIFDLWVGGKDPFVQRYHEFLTGLGTLVQRQVEVHYIQGNHDFLLENAIGKILGVKLHPQDVALSIGQKKFYIAHGDLVDRSDYFYRILRVFFRSPIMRGLVWALPGNWMDRFGEFSSRRSRKGRPILPQDLPSGRMESLRRVYRSFAADRIAEGYDYVVLGHCHDLDEMSFQVGSREGQYVNIGYPRAHGSFLSWRVGNKKIERERLPAHPG